MTCSEPHQHLNTNCSANTVCTINNYFNQRHAQNNPIMTCRDLSPSIERFPYSLIKLVPGTVTLNQNSLLYALGKLLF